MHFYKRLIYKNTKIYHHTKRKHLYEKKTPIHRYSFRVRCYLFEKITIYFSKNIHQKNIGVTPIHKKKNGEWCMVLSFRNKKGFITTNVAWFFCAPQNNEILLFMINLSSYVYKHLNISL